MRLTLALIPLALATPAFAQQQQQQMSPPEAALQINGIIGTWAQTIVQQGKMIEDLRKQIAADDAKIKELEDGHDKAAKAK